MCMRRIRGRLWFWTLLAAALRLDIQHHSLPRIQRMHIREALLAFTRQTFVRMRRRDDGYIARQFILDFAVEMVFMVVA